MNYLRNKQFTYPQRKRKILIFFLFLILVLILFRKPIINFIDTSFQKIGYFFWPASNMVKNNLSDSSYIFKTRSALNEENRNLKDQLSLLTAKQADYSLLFDENIKLKEIFNRKEERSLTLATILAKPSQSLYDTLIVDVGSIQGIKIGQKVFVQGNVLIGQIFEVYDRTSKVKLYSSPGEKTDALVTGKDIYVQAIGRGGQNFEITLPQDFVINIGDQVLFPNIGLQVLGVVEEVISDPRDPLKKILLRSPINMNELKFVEIESQK